MKFIVSNPNNKFTLLRGTPDASDRDFIHGYVNNSDKVNGTIQGDWAQLSSGLFIRSKYLIKEKFEFVPTCFLGHRNGHCTFRSKPKRDNNLFIGGKIYNGIPAMCLEEVPGWAMLCLEDGRSGWIMTEHCYGTQNEALQCGKSAPARPPTQYVLIQLRNTTCHFPDMFGLVGDCSDRRTDSSMTTTIREAKEEAGLRDLKLHFVTGGKHCDYYYSTTHAKFGFIRDKHETQDISKSSWARQWIQSVGGRIACHGHAWVPVSAFDKGGAADAIQHRFMTGIPDRVRHGLSVSKGNPCNGSPSMGKNGFLMLFNSF